MHNIGKFLRLVVNAVMDDIQPPDVIIVRRTQLATFKPAHIDIIGYFDNGEGHLPRYRFKRYMEDIEMLARSRCFGWEVYYGPYPYASSTI